MVLIPQKESTRDTTTVPGIAPRSPDIASVGGRIIQQIGGALKSVADQFQKARTLEEVTKADTEATRRLGEIQLEASRDPDVWDIAKYQGKISKIRDEASKGISIPAARNSFQASFEKDAIAADFNIRKTMHKRQIDSMKATMLENLDALKEDYLNAGSPQQKTYLRFKKDKLLIDRYVQLGVIDKEAAFKLKKTTSKEWEEGSIRDAIATDAPLAKDMILAGDFKDLTADETAKWIEVADKKVARNKKVAEDARDQMWLDNEAAIMENLEGTSVQDIIEAFTKGDISPEVASDMVDAKTDPEILPNQYETDQEVWKEMARDLVRPKQDLREFMKRISKGVSDGKIQFTEAAEFSAQVKDFFDSAIDFKSRPNRFHQLVGAVMDAFKNWAEVTPIPGPVTFFMTKEFVKKIKDGKITEENVEEEGQKIIEDAKKVLNPNRAQFKIGEMVDTPAGPREIKAFDVDGEPLILRVK